MLKTALTAINWLTSHFKWLVIGIIANLIVLLLTCHRKEIFTPVPLNTECITSPTEAIILKLQDSIVVINAELLRQKRHELDGHIQHEKNLADLARLPDDSLLNFFAKRYSPYNYRP